MTSTADTVASPRAMVWLLRILWVALAPLLAASITGGLENAPDSGRLTAAVLWWAVVAAGVVALVVPSTAALTGVRMVTPLTVAVAVATLLGGAGTAVGGAALGVAVLAAAVALAGETTEAFVQASAYGQEHRFPLRTPAVVLPAAVLVWLVWGAAVVTAAVLLGNAVWVAGAVVAAAAAALTLPVAQRLHALARRWLVLVPAGVVLHDPVVLGESLMLPSANLASAGLALAGTEALDLTGPAAGHAVEIRAKEMVLAQLRASRSQPTGRAVHVQSYLTAPVRPGRALAAMAAKGHPVR